MENVYVVCVYVTEQNACECGSCRATSETRVTGLIFDRWAVCVKLRVSPRQCLEGEPGLKERLLITSVLIPLRTDRFSVFVAMFLALIW